VRHTKIVATIGPASSTDTAIRDLIAAGVNVFRLNFSHGTHENHAEVITRIRSAAQQSRRCIAILQDLSGPKIRTGPLAGGRPIELKRGDELRIVTGDFPGEPGRVSTPYADLPRSVRPGDTLLLDDGRIELRVEDSEAREMRTRVIQGGPLGEHKGINAPGVPLPSAGLTEKDAEDLVFGVRSGVDFVALSFVQSAADLRMAREALACRSWPSSSAPRPSRISRISSRRAMR
jgi:pyruvate kinase